MTFSSVKKFLQIFVAFSEYIIFMYVVCSRFLQSNCAIDRAKFKLCKDWPIKKMTNFKLGHFTTIFGHFFANYIYIFHKTEVLMVILRG